MKPQLRKRGWRENWFVSEGHGHRVPSGKVEKNWRCWHRSFRNLRLTVSFHHSLQAQASRHLPELLPLSGKNANQLLTRAVSEAPARGPTKTLCAVGKEHGAPGRLGGWGRGAAREDDVPTPRYLRPHPLSSQPVHAWNFTTREDRPRWVNHPGWRCRNLGEKDTENLFSVPLATPAIPGKGLGIFSW